MSGPPKDTGPSELWVRLQEMPRPSRVVDFPRKMPTGESVGQVAIWVLTQEEQMAAAAEAEKLAKRLVKDGKREDLGYEALYADAVCVEVLARACRVDGELKRPAFPSAGQIRELLTVDEIAALFNHYLTVQLELGPTVARMSEQEMNAWVERLAEGGSAFPFDLLSSDLQKILVLFMARRLVSSSTDMSSAGSPLADEPSDSAEQIGDDDAES